MSWAFFCEVCVTLPTAELDRIWKTSTRDHALPTPIFGFEDPALEETFSVDHSGRDANEKLAKLPRWFSSYSGRSTKTTRAGETTFRGAMVLDRSSDPYIGKTVAALFFAARPKGRGHLLLVNDGSYSGEDGVVLELDGGEVVTSRIADCNPVAEALGEALFEGGRLPTPEALLLLAKGEKAAAKKPPPEASTAKKPAAGKSAAKPAPTKPRAKK